MELMNEPQRLTHRANTPWFTRASNFIVGARPRDGEQPYRFLSPLSQVCPFFWKYHMRYLTAFLALSFACAQPSAIPVKVQARLVDADLNVKAVPKHVLQVVRTKPGRHVISEATTDFDGKADFALPAGEYRLQSKAP